MHPASPNSRRARIAARMANASIQEVTIDVAAGENRTPEYLALNPMGKVPTLVMADGTALLESYAIAWRLAGGSDALPSADEAEVLRWQFFDACHFARPLGTLTFQHLFRPSPDDAIVAEALKEWGRYASVLEAALRGREFVIGSTPTIADAALGASLTYAVPCQLPLAEYPQISAWLQRCSELPAFAQTAPPSRASA